MSDVALSSTSMRRSGDETFAADELATIAHALGHLARVAIVQRLADSGPTLTGDIVKGSGLAQSTVSEHLRVLREAGLVVSRRDGQRVWYCVVPGTLAGFIDALSTVTDVRDQRCVYGPHIRRRLLTNAVDT